MSQGHSPEVGAAPEFYNVEPYRKHETVHGRNVSSNYRRIGDFLGSSTPPPPPVHQSIFSSPHNYPSVYLRTPPVFPISMDHHAALMRCPPVLPFPLHYSSSPHHSPLSTDLPSPHQSGGSRPVHPSLIFGHCDFSQWLQVSYAAAAAAAAAAAIGLNFSLPYLGSSLSSRVAMETGSSYAARFSPYVISTTRDHKSRDDSNPFKLSLPRYPSPAHLEQDEPRRGGGTTSSTSTTFHSPPPPVLPEDLSSSEDSQSLFNNSSQLRSMERMLKDLRHHRHPPTSPGAGPTTTTAPPAGDDLPTISTPM